MDDNNVHQFAIEFTDGLKFEFGAYVNISLNGAAVGEALKFKATLTPNTAITITVPSFS